MLRVVSARAATVQLRPISASRPGCRGGPGNETECPGSILPDRDLSLRAERSNLYSQFSGSQPPPGNQYLPGSAR